MRSPWAIGAILTLAACGRIGFDPLAGPGLDAVLDNPEARLVLGGEFACLLDKTGTLYCWGDNAENQLGLGATDPGTDKNVPTRSPGHVWKDIALGERHACALDGQGAAWCWGSNSYGQAGLSPPGCGDGTTSPPEQCDDGDTANNGSCNCLCQTGGTPSDVIEPTQLPTSTRFSRIFAKSYTTCAIATDGGLWCWGRNGAQQLGVGGNTDRGRPEPVLIVAPQSGSDHAWAQVGVGDDHNCAVQTGGSLWCMGANAAGELGQGGSTTIVRDRPEVVVSGSSWSEVHSGIDMSCALSAAGSLACWGRNDAGQLGLGDNNPRDVPSLVDPGPWNHLAVGVAHACATHANGSTRCWGDNPSGAVGNGVSGSIVLVPVSISGTFTDIAAGSDFTCALDGGGNVWCWGTGNNGRLGTGDSMSVTVPTRTVSFGGG